MVPTITDDNHVIPALRLLSSWGNCEAISDIKCNVLRQKIKSRLLLGGVIDFRWEIDLSPKVSNLKSLQNDYDLNCKNFILLHR